jgi:hypothetical protein
MKETYEFRASQAQLSLQGFSLTFVAACADIFEIQFPVKVRNIYEYC